MFTITPRTRIQEGASWEDIQDGDCYETGYEISNDDGEIIYDFASEGTKSHYEGLNRKEERFNFVCDLVDTLTDTGFGSPLFDADDNMRLALEAFGGIRFDRKVKVGTVLVLDENNAKDFILYPYDRPHIGDTVSVIFPGVKVRQSNGSSVMVRKPMVKKV